MYYINPKFDDQCPECLQSWKGAPIPPEFLSSYCAVPEYYSRLIRGVVRGMEDDGVCYWECPDCHAKFHAFYPGDPRRDVVHNMFGM